MNKTTPVIGAAELSSKNHLETEANVDAFVAELKAEPMAAAHAGQMPSIQRINFL